MCVQLAVAYFAYLRWAVTVPHGGGHSAPAGPAALPPRGPGAPVSVQALGEGPVRHALPLVAPLAKDRQSVWVPLLGESFKGGGGVFPAVISSIETCVSEC